MVGAWLCIIKKVVVGVWHPEWHKAKPTFMFLASALRLEMESSKRRQDQQLDGTKPRSRRSSAWSNMAAADAGDEGIDVGRLSPQSRRRYQSRMSSARLRERQRQRISSAEDEVARLEAYVHSLQSSLDFHYQTRGTHSIRLSSAGGMDKNIHTCKATGDHGAGVEDMDGIRKSVAEFLQRKDELIEHKDRNGRADACVGVVRRTGAVDDVSRQVYGSIASMNDTVDHLEKCVQRIEILKETIAKRVHLLEEGTQPADAMRFSATASLFVGSTLHNTADNSSASVQGSMSGQALQSAHRTDSSHGQSGDGPSSRYSISFLVDEHNM
ncbi:hypothetical protein COEREDRAFT_94160 [Coemansia reversa NRRL 1564]|uniref:BZIP domain-containing protein n=1 Tax=Coemansia reversa (strain ATCC 12441 / NRRL 1564) TaxID=763665 RepID=A0A2G5B4Y6_COERN|nr:hypothetical protein COEREDRAFT_94160 [Coemansia reversa NRRL 1564]|eukprot:PIA14066.1 hypothetical protein COEREDRAFT_94160 [Coemansia reversa NRRL 1564]